MEQVRTAVIRLEDIRPSAYNPRVTLTAKDREYKALDGSIQENGLVVPMIVNIRDNTLISGHQRLNVLKAAGETETNAVIVDMDEAQAKAVMIALNKLDGYWDYGRVADILQEIVAAKESLLSTGFTEKDVQELLGDIMGELEGEDEDPERLAKKGDTREGIKCVVGEFTFRLTDEEFEDMMADICEKVGFVSDLVCDEMKRRLFG